MKHFRLALFCAILLIGTTGNNCRASLAAYSETRSFRDALEGRSMEEAISGPVDKDTSSYGERTPSSSAAGSPSAAGGYGSSNQANGGQQSPMMLNIPANGNLNPQSNPMGQQDEQQQASRESGPELEREAGPIDGPEAGGSGKQLMEQKLMAMMMAMNQMGSMKNLRQTGARAAGRPLAPISGPRGARLQQQYDSSASAAAGGDYGSANQASAKTSGETGFGEQEKSRPADSYGQQASGGYAPTTQSSLAAEDEEQQQQQSPGAAMDDQQPQGYSGVQEQEQQQQQQQLKEMSAKQKAMTAMLMSMNNGARYSRAQSSVPASLMKLMMAKQAGGQQQQYGDKMTRTPVSGQQTSSQMAQNMIASLASKAAYMNGQQRQMAPPMLMAGQRAAYGQQASGAGAGNQPANGYGNAQQRSAMAAMLAMNGSGSPMRGNMRRANQRRYEKKMSPAMLNKMLAAQKQADQYGAGRPAAGMSMQMAEMMKTPAGAEMMAQLMQMNGAKREQYKRLMMSAMQPQQQPQQQQQQEDDYSQQRQTSETDSYGANQGAGKSPASGESGYGAQTGSTLSPPMAATMMMRNKMGYKANKMADNYLGQQQQAETDQLQQQQQSADANTDNYQSQQQSMTNEGSAKGTSSTARPMMASLYSPASSAMSPTNGQSKRYGAGSRNSGSSYGSDSATAEGMSMMNKPQVSMSMADAYATNAASAGDMSQSAKGKNTGGYANGNGKPAPSAYDAQPALMSTMIVGGKSSGDSYASSGSMSRPKSPEYAAAADEQQQLEEKPAQQQQTDEYGAAPMGQAEPFAFNYKIDDNYGNNQYRKEKSDENGVVRGSYGYMDQAGLYRHVEYVADENGFRANIKSNEPGLSTEMRPANEAASTGGSANSGAAQQQSTMSNMMSMMNGAGGSEDSTGQQQEQELQQPMASPVAQQQQQQTTEEGVKSK